MIQREECNGCKEYVLAKVTEVGHYHQNRETSRMGTISAFFLALLFLRLSTAAYFSDAFCEDFDLFHVLVASFASPTVPVEYNYGPIHQTFENRIWIDEKYL